MPETHPPRKTVYYTFGNHMHWVDMEWLWGYDVLPGSVRDMLHLIEQAGVKGNINFDGIGYEKMAAECPDALADLRAAVQDGRIEVVGASYGQPYGLFHGGESNIRQRVFGVRAVMRLLGVRPRAFWEEEFDFCPQLPQILRGCGYTGACLFFQWTWHTPEVPFEPHSVILWEGVDGSRLPCAPRNELNLHQWPEDFAPLFESTLLRDLEKPAILQWVELMPSPDWMCRSDVLLPKLRELLADKRFKIEPVTLSGLLESATDREPPVRRYSMDDVWHGVSLAKNDDQLRKRSRECERQILAAESASAFAGLFGRPYPGWDVYPTWELDEAWRELLSAQHHDNDECEGLCGFVGKTSYTRADHISRHVVDRTLRHLARRAARDPDEELVFNPLGWTRDIAVYTPASQHVIVRDVPAFGYAIHNPLGERLQFAPAPSVEEGEHVIAFSRRGLRFAIDKKTGLITEFTSAAIPEGLVDRQRSWGYLEATFDGRVDVFETAEINADSDSVRVSRFARNGAQVDLELDFHPLHDAVRLKVTAQRLPRPEPRMHAGLQILWPLPFSKSMLLVDTPYAIDSIRAAGRFRRKYPTGDWMTSPQVFEDVVRPFTALQMIDVLHGDNVVSAPGLLYVHDSHQCFFREDRGFRHLLTMYDAWDEQYFHSDVRAQMFLVPHGPMTHAQRYRLAMELTAPTLEAPADERCSRDIPSVMGTVHVDAPSVLVSAFYRESHKSGESLAPWAGREMGSHPYVIRLVEFNGEPAEVTLRLPGRVAKAARTNLMGELESALAPEPAAAPFGPSDLPWSALTLKMRPREIATVMADLELGRKQTRDLDAHRDVWATVHRT